MKVHGEDTFTQKSRIFFMCVFCKSVPDLLCRSLTILVSIVAITYINNSLHLARQRVCIHAIVLDS